MKMEQKFSLAMVSLKVSHNLVLIQKLLLSLNMNWSRCVELQTLKKVGIVGKAEVQVDAIDRKVLRSSMLLVSFDIDVLPF